MSNHELPSISPNKSPKEVSKQVGRIISELHKRAEPVSGKISTEYDDHRLVTSDNEMYGTKSVSSQKDEFRGGGDDQQRIKTAREHELQGHRQEATRAYHTGASTGTNGKSTIESEVASPYTDEYKAVEINVTPESRSAVIRATGKEDIEVSGGPEIDRAIVDRLVTLRDEVQSREHRAKTEDSKDKVA